MSLRVVCDICGSTVPLDEATSDAGWRFLVVPERTVANQIEAHLCSPTCVTRWGLANGAKVRTGASAQTGEQRLKLRDILQASSNEGIDLREIDGELGSEPRSA
ncbi:hypothetical protein [Euzebya tangerina]|uniref:hypothetical protein n=1 Tax=Euzebya tangerina TaxID=591198 RepID=UPI0013C3296C|nr:hypothetical protein [Euzebya tangerina]